jgi:hypothetical protein
MDEVQALWKGQPVEPKALSPEEIRGKALRFQRTVRMRNLREYAAAAIVVVVFGAYVWGANTWLSKAGPALIVLGTLYIVLQLYVRAASPPVPGAERCVDFHRRELERQRDLLRTVPRWYLLPLVPGLSVMFVDRFLDAWAKGGTAIAMSLGSALVTILIFLGVWWLNVVGARRLQREIDALARAGAGDRVAP